MIFLFNLILIRFDINDFFFYFFYFIVFTYDIDTITKKEKKRKKEKERKKLHNFLLSYSTYSFLSTITFHHITLHVSFVSDNFFRYTFR